MTNKPNILVLMTDQQRFDALGCAGNAKIRTPNIDRLADSGVYFTRAYCPTPVCVASRMSFITGLRMAHHHWVQNKALPGPIPELPTIMTLLHRAGHHTEGIGKMHFFGRHYGFQNLQRSEECIDFRIDDDYFMYLKDQGVRMRYPSGLRDLLYYQPQTSDIPTEHSKAAWVTRQSVQFLRDHQRHRPGKPFFLWSSWISPHPPFAPGEPYDTMYNPEDMDLPVFPERSADTIPCWGARGRLDGAHLDPPRIKRIRALYYGMIAEVDDSVGKILDTLETLDMANNTAVLFVSDHGDMLGDHGLSQKNVPYEASARIPMILRWPDRTEAGRRCDDLVGLEDFLPTLAAELGLERDPQAPPLTGASLLGRPGGGLAGPRDAYFIDYDCGPGRWISMRTPTHKYALWARGGFEELYDLQNDPDEVRNLAQTEPERSAKMRARVLEWEHEHGLPESFTDGTFRTFPFPKPPTDLPRHVSVNEGRWPENLPKDEQDSVESYAEAFDRAIAKETTLAPEKLSLKQYKDKGGHSLEKTAWEQAWKEA